MPDVRRRCGSMRKISDLYKTNPTRMAENGAMTTQISVSLGYRDPLVAMNFLTTALGFERREIHDDGDGLIHHARLDWPGVGAIHLHSAESDDNSVAGLSNAAADQGYPAFSIHIDVEDPDALYDRALAAGARVIRELQDSPHGVGTRGFIVSDPEGLYWSVGTPLPQLTRGSDGAWVPAE